MNRDFSSSAPLLFESSLLSILLLLPFSFERTSWNSSLKRQPPAEWEKDFLLNNKERSWSSTWTRYYIILSGALKNKTPIYVRILIFFSLFFRNFEVIAGEKCLYARACPSCIYLYFIFIHRSFRIKVMKWKECVWESERGNKGQSIRSQARTGMNGPFTNAGSSCAHLNFYLVQISS